MARGTLSRGSKSGAESAELNRDVCAALTHELGGIAGALDLRAAALAATLPKEDHAALHTLADEVRLVTRGVRLVRGSSGTDAMLPMRLQSLEEWWKLVSRFTGFVLPRGAYVETRLSAGSFSNGQATVATWLWLAACKDLAVGNMRVPCAITLSAGPSPDGGNDVTLLAEFPAERLPSSRRTAARMRWIRYATRLAETHSVELAPWKRDGQVMRWRCTVPRG